MDSNPQSCENPEIKSTEDETQNQNQVSQSPFATASLFISSFPTTLPTQFFIQPKILSLFSPQSPSKAKIPNQASSLSNLSPSPSKSKFKSTFSNNPLQSPLSLTPRRPLDPSNGAAIRRSSIVWFRNDLRVHDNECLTTANNESMTVGDLFVLIWLEGRTKHCRGLKNLQLNVKHSHTRGARMVTRSMASDGMRISQVHV